MTSTIVTSREFNQDAGKAKKAARNGPVIITDRGRPSHVLLTIEDYQRLTGQRTTIVDLIAMRSRDEVEFDPPRLRSGLFEPADLG